jgi:hypothetical protein
MLDYTVEIEADRWKPGHWNPADVNTDVCVRFNDGTTWAATFFTYQNISTLRDKNRGTGECLMGGYCCATNMILIDEGSRDRIEQVVEDLIRSGEFKAIFQECDAEREGDDHAHKR